MNAIVGLCHFCEAHGPRPLFCTFTTDNEEHTTESSSLSVQCNGCTSLGPETVLVSRDDDGTIFCSRESVPNTEIMGFLRKAAIRSITCEVNWNKEGGVVYFSDQQGHVLSYTFQVRDTRARGLKRWFSIVVLMKDKMLLQNISTLLAQHMKTISKELQDLATVVYDNEQQICSQRALRLRTGRNDFGQSRSLMQLTGNENVFKNLHSHFTWMLRVGAKAFTETLHTSQSLINKLSPQTIKGSIFDDEACSVAGGENCIQLRALEGLLSKDVFRILLYCTLTGVHTYIKTTHRDPSTIISCILRVLPMMSKQPSHIKPYNNEAVSNCCLLEEIEENIFVCKWSGSVPLKCPTLMNRIENAMINDKFNDEVLNQQVKSLQLEWLGIARTVKATIVASGPKSNAVVKLKQMFGVTQHDEQMLNFWTSAFCE